MCGLLFYHTLPHKPHTNSSHTHTVSSSCFYSFIFIHMKKPNIYSVLGHANQFAFDDGGKSVFQSYNSICAVIDWKKQTLTLGRDWDYSKTTRKHLYAFFADMGLYSLSCIDDVRHALKDGKIGDFKIAVDYSL